jgi:hypothetical protein
MAGAKKGERRGGRQKGTPNKTTGALKDMILQALADAGGVKYLAAMAITEPRGFMALLGRVLPLQVTGSIDLSFADRLVRARERARSRTAPGD